MMSGDLAGKSFIVTGGGGDIGGATVAMLLERGAQVAVLDNAAVTGARLEPHLASGRLVAHVCDVTSEHQVIDAIAAARLTVGKIHGIVNAAGIEGRRTPLDQCATEMFLSVMAVNVTGVFLCMKHVIPHLLENGGGAIVNVCSTAGFKGVPGMAPYVASKHAVLGLTRSGALEWGRRGIRVNCVAPGPVEGRMIASIFAEGADDPGWPSLDNRKRQNPSGRFADPREIAAVIAFLLSDASPFANGALFAVDGGVSAL